LHWFLILAVLQPSQEPACPAAAERPPVAAAPSVPDGLTTEQWIEVHEANWRACVDAAARDTARRAGRAAGGRPLPDDIYAQCNRLEAQLSAVLAALPGRGGEEGAATHIGALKARLRPALEALIYETYQSHNYD
jgi:hypothetical protein